MVALRKESVDRNVWAGLMFGIYMVVALRKESVDRNNNSQKTVALQMQVALRKESVDRNILFGHGIPPKETSLSVRRAWIEIRGLHPNRAHPCRRSP